DWVDQNDTQKQLVKNVLTEPVGVTAGKRAISRNPVREAFQFMVEEYKSGDTVCIFGFGEHGSSASLQLADMLHTDFAADLCHLPGTKVSSALVAETSIVRCIAVNYNRDIEVPSTLLNSTIARLRSSVERVICTNEYRGRNMFACSATRGLNGRLQPEEIWQFDRAPPWRTNRYWLIKQTVHLIHYQPTQLRNWFNTRPRLSMILESQDDTMSIRKSGLGPQKLTFKAHRAHRDHVVQIAGEDEFDLYYQVWTL
ncbi:hypothetical protein FRC07_005824, partial [Ceratobasidium sp. 392]